MANAYTPGLKVSPNSIIIKHRRLPILGETLVSVGDLVNADTPVAMAYISGNPQSINVASLLGCEAGEITEFMIKKEGDAIEKGEVIAKKSSFFGLFKSQCTATATGVLEHVSKVTGQVIVREAPTPIRLDAYVKGKVIGCADRESVTIETHGAFIQGIFGVGGERNGVIKMMVDSPDGALDADKITADCKGKILIGGALMSGVAIKKAAQVGALGVVTGGIIDSELVAYLGFDIGVAITGQEDIPLSLIVTEGFGSIPMAQKTFHLLKSLDGKVASINGATQIRAGVMRPEIIVPYDEEMVPTDKDQAEGGMMEIGTPVRCIREPYFGQLAQVVALPAQLTLIETGAKVRIVTVKLQSGEVVTVPRANVEIIG